MIKVDIVNEVSRVADVTKVKAELAVDAVFEAMRHSMQRGERIELRGFGVFQPDTDTRCDERPRGHELGYRAVIIGRLDKTQVAIGEDTHQLLTFV